jgi:branched-chain amino acid transport system substrate-binding protein
MKKANSAEPAKYLPELAKIDFKGATGQIAFDDKGDRKGAEITIFTMKAGKLEPIAIVKGGQTVSYEDFIKASAPAPAAAPAAEAKPAAEPAKDAKK